MDPYLSQTVQSLTRSKIHELEKQKSLYESSKNKVLLSAQSCPNSRERVACLLEGAKDLSPNAYQSPEVRNIEHWVEQARYDASIPLKKLEEFETYLRNLLDAQSRKLNLADLYSRLLTEWMDPVSEKEQSPLEDSIGEEGFTVIEERQKQRLQQLCDQFEQMVFEPCETDPAEINAFLGDLFVNEEQKKSLEWLREEVSRKMDKIWKEKDPFTVDSLDKCIRGIQSEEIISEGKQETLKHFLSSKVALNEIADVLNMRYADLPNWNWKVGTEGVPVLPRQQLNGKYRIWMDDDVLETIFVEHICIRVCNALKAALKQFIFKDGSWNFHQGPEMTDRDLLRREYYLTNQNESSMYESRRFEYRNTFFLSSLPDDESTLASRTSGYDEDDDDSAYEDGERADDPANKNVKQRLLRTIVTETLLRHRLNGKAAVVQSDLQWFSTSIPHSTIYTILRFVGFSEDWIEFLRKYIETPLNMDKAFEGHEETGVRTRRRGIPIAHASEKVIGEMTLFFMDLAVNRKTGMLLYRLHDDIWLSGEPGKCAEAWNVMTKFAGITGLRFNKHKSGSVCLGSGIDGGTVSQLPKGLVKIGFLMLDAQTGDWVIDQSQVDDHVEQLRTQLDQCNSIISWVRTWNSCIGRFFKNTFGEPAYCFGRPHVDAILCAYEKMHRMILGTQTSGTASTVTDYLRRKIQLRFGVSDIPDSFFFLSENLGGLGLRNPFVSMFLVRKILTQSPLELVEATLRKERIKYDEAKNQFEKLSRKQRLRKLNDIMDNRTTDDEIIIREAEIDTFMNFEEWSRFRDSNGRDFEELYKSLQEVPSAERPRRKEIIEEALEAAQSQFNIGSLSPEMKWTLYLYAEDLLAKFGGLNLVDKQFLPTGVLDMIKGKKVKWQMVL
ncbi:reverse transcriptase [Penicillium angulare]|uniref:Reverse transcriptase n=1 Tax=Penicillium angulare TaxID=116970 RepID=A0A9W9EFP9_9EURO|nr:reverse transcriptase [Penicillium angulare]